MPRAKQSRVSPGTLSVKGAEERERPFIKREGYVVRESRKREHSTWLFLGLAIGILGNFIVSVFYDLVRGITGWMFWIISLDVVLFFVLLSYVLLGNMREYRRNVAFVRAARRRAVEMDGSSAGPIVRFSTEDHF